MAAKVFSGPAPLGVTYHVPPPRLAELKAEAEAGLPAGVAANGGAGGGGSGGGESGKEWESEGGAPAGGGIGGAGGIGGGGGSDLTWVSTHDALIARVWQAVASLPARASRNSTPLTLGLDMRGRLPAGECGVPPEEQRRLYGNLATTLYVPEMDVASRPGRPGPTLGEVALHIRRSLAWSAAAFPDDVAHATLLDAPPGALHRVGILPLLRIIEDAASGRVPLLMTTTWALDFSETSFDGRPPAAALPAFSPGFPIVIAQPAPPGAGAGGFTVTVWLWREEHEQLLERVPEL